MLEMKFDSLGPRRSAVPGLASLPVLIWIIRYADHRP